MNFLSIILLGLALSLMPAASRSESVSVSLDIDGDGQATALRRGAGYEAALDSLATKYEQYSDKRPQDAIMFITPTTWRSWSFS